MNKKLCRSKIKESFIQLLLKKSIDKIKIAEICKNAGTARSTFYLYFESVYDLMEEIEDEILLESNKTREAYERDRPATYENSYEFNLVLYRHVLKHRDAYRALLGPHGDIFFHYKYRTQIEKNFSSRIKSVKTVQNNPEITFYFMSAGNVETTYHWLETQCCPIEEYAQTMVDMMYKAFDFK